MGIHRLPNGIVNGAALRTAHPTAYSLVVASAVLSGDGLRNDEARMPSESNLGFQPDRFVQASQRAGSRPGRDARSTGQAGCQRYALPANDEGMTNVERKAMRGRIALSRSRGTLRAKSMEAP